jgi:hypothetical protein
MNCFHRHACTWLVTAVLACTPGCTISRELHGPDQAGRLDVADSPFLKAHLRNGEVVVLQLWRYDEKQAAVFGHGERRDMNRKLVERGELHVDLKDVALFETNTPKANPGPVAALAVVGVLSAAVSVACIANPKACFGSCPTFYASDGQRDYLAAEGFSESVAPSLEATDVDALWRLRAHGRTVSLRVTNEALETHVIRQANLLAVPRPPGGRVVHTNGIFHTVTALQPPTACRVSEGDCLAAVLASDELERSSVTDGEDLATRETVELTFDPSRAPAHPGLVLETRQGFITTFLFYQALAFMGRKAGHYLAELERGDPQIRGKASELYHLLGGIDVQVESAPGLWQNAGTYSETGPLAREVQMIPLPTAGTGRVRLVMARGHFRLGMVALAEVGDAVTPVRVRPARITTTAGDAQLARQWVGGEAPALVTLPGDEHRLEYELPADAQGLELFMESRGYYLEWMRQQWLAEESDYRMLKLFKWPSAALRDLAPAYRKIEPRIEAMFWESRYVR